MLENIVKTFYVDYMGYDIKYNLGDREMTVLDEGAIYHHFNGFLHLGVF